MNVAQTNNSASQINTQIERVQSKRQSSINLVRKKLARLNIWKEGVNSLESKRLKLLQKYPQFVELVDSLADCSLDSLARKIDREIKAWEDLLKRCSRQTINFGVAGSARQGKSTFLQNITGLGNEYLPANPGLPCTSVQSNIYYHDGETRAVVNCFSESEFLEQIIHPYYQQLKFNPPSSLEEFALSPLPHLPPNAHNQAENEALYNHLINYHTHISAYRHLIQSEPLSFEIDRDRIARYVSQQYENQDKSKPINFEHLAVSQVDIHCKFPNNQVKNIGFVDTIGLGDTRMGDTERLMKAIGQEVDFILLLRQASNNDKGDLWRPKEDIYLYDRINQALLDKLPLAECSAMIFNLDGHNQNMTKVLKDSMSSKGIKVSQTFEINCKNPQETSTVVHQLLSYLANNIEALDRQYMKGCEASYQSLQMAIEEEIDRIEGLLAQYHSTDERFIRLCEQKIDDLYSRVETLREQSQSTTTPDPYLQGQINSALEKCQAIPIPDLSKLGTITDVHAIEAPLRKGIEALRPKVLAQFHSLDVSLNQSLGQQKTKIATMLAEWCLSTLSQEEGNELLKEMAENLPPSLTNLRLGFQFLTDFEIQYRGLIQSEIYNSINLPLPANKYRPLEISAAVYEPNNNIQTLKNIQAELEERRIAAIENSREALEDLLDSLQQASISMLEEWAAHTTQADGVREEWRIFLSKYRHDIWEELQAVGAVEEWLEMLAQLAIDSPSPSISP